MAKSTARPRPPSDSALPPRGVQAPPAGNVAVGAPTAASPRPSHEHIARRAYELFEARGRAHGHHDEDWMQAERELMLRRR